MGKTNDINGDEGRYLENQRGVVLCWQSVLLHRRGESE